MSHTNDKKICLEISMDDQALDLVIDGERVRRFPVSTSAKGMGFTEGSFRTPTGNFRVSEKIGEGEPMHTRFVARVPVGDWDPLVSSEDDLILTRILRLQGKDSENANSEDRYIYIHGTNREDQIGTAASHGCIRLANPDMIELFDLVPVAAEVCIQPLTRVKGKLLFVDCDSTLSSIEGIDELARLSGPEIFKQVVKLTNSAMNGEIALSEVFERRMEIIKPNKEMIDKVSKRYIETIVPGVEKLLDLAISNEWIPVIISGGFAQIIRPLADNLGITHVEAVPLKFDNSGEYVGYDKHFPTTRNLGKNEIIQEWKRALLPERVLMIGDGISDLETKPDVELMIGFGGVVARDKVKKGADRWLTNFNDMNDLKSIFS